MIRYFYTIAHILSQKIKCYIPVDHEGVKKKLQTHKSIIESRNDWSDFIFHIAYDLRLLPEVFLKKCPPDLLSEAIDNHIQQSHEKSFHYIVYSDNNYPRPLKEIPNPPLGLSIAGPLSSFHQTGVSIVGSRKASYEALCLAFDLGVFFAKKDYSIISGGAFGCDINCHRGYLASRTKSAKAILVFAGGFQHTYPKSNQRTFDAIKASGGNWVTERLWGDPSFPMDYPVRNRIISGLSKHVVVVQAQKPSGALITAEIALDHGRDLWVWKQTTKEDIRSSGNQALIDDGAPYFANPKDLFYWLQQGEK